MELSMVTSISKQGEIIAKTGTSGALSRSANELHNFRFQIPKEWIVDSC